MSKNKRGFPPVSDKNAIVLILGSMPGEESLRQQQYYAHPRNTFWKILGNLFNFNSDMPYTDRKKELIKNRIALWDVMKECERDGSLDSSIKNHTIEENDFETFFKKHPNIRYIYFNGSKAELEFKKRVKLKLNNLDNFTFEKLPSTSPAMAMMNFEKKLDVWSVIKKVLFE